MSNTNTSTEATKAKRVRGTNVYRVNTPDGGHLIVEATTEKAAISFVVGKFFVAKKLNPSEIVEAVRSGAEILSAVATDDGQASLDDGAEGGQTQA